MSFPLSFPILAEALYPELRRWAPAERPHCLRVARDTPLDAFELFGMAAGLVLVTALTRYAADGLDLAARFGAALGNYLIALPLLALVLAPFHIRRVRRGLARQAADPLPPAPVVHS